MPLLKCELPRLRDRRSYLETRHRYGWLPTKLPPGARSRRLRMNLGPPISFPVYLANRMGCPQSPANKLFAVLRVHASLATVQEKAACQCEIAHCNPLCLHTAPQTSPSYLRSSSPLPITTVSFRNIRFPAWLRPSRPRRRRPRRPK